MREIKKAPITNEERDLVFELADGVPGLIPYIGHMRIICNDAHQVSYMDILRWLKRERLTGTKLMSWIQEKHQGSILRAIAFARMKVHSDFGIKKIFAKPL